MKIQEDVLLKLGANFQSPFFDNYKSKETEVLHKCLENDLEQISNLIGHFTTVSESRLTLALLSLFRCLSYVTHRRHNPGIIPLFLFCLLFFHRKENSLLLTLPAVSFGTLMFEAEYIKDDTPSALIIMVLPNSVQSRDLHRSNFACSLYILRLKFIILFPFSS